MVPSIPVRINSLTHYMQLEIETPWYS
jgi:hypothetical protein